MSSDNPSSHSSHPRSAGEQFVTVNPAPARTSHDKENAVRPHSAGWLKNPAYIDGGVNPPQFYYSEAELRSAHHAALTGAFARRDAGFLQDHGCDNAPARVPDRRPVLHPSVVLDSVVRVLEPSAASSETPSNASTTDDVPAPHANGGNVVEAGTTSLELAGYLVSITVCYTSVEKATGCGARPAAKKIRVTKSDYIDIDGITRSTFVTKMLAVHDLAKDYAPGVHSGPSFKLWFTGSSGGKSGAPSIETDRDFAVSLEALQRKNKKTCMVSAELDLDIMEGFRIRSKGLSAVMQDTSQDEELLYGTRVPHVSLFGDTTQAHGAIILKLKKKWTCQEHLGEHGEPGHCYITPGGEHVGLNPRRLALWASAIHANDATKHEPPNTIEFDGVRDGRVVAVKPRGRSGPGAASTDNATSAMLIAAMVPLLTSLVDRNSVAVAAPSSGPSMSATAASSLKRPLSPASDIGNELNEVYVHSRMLKASILCRIRTFCSVSISLLTSFLMCQLLVSVRSLVQLRGAS